MALSRAGIRLTQVQQLEDAEQLDGLSFHRKGAKLQTAAMTSFAPPLVWITCQAVGIRAHDGDDNGTTNNNDDDDRDNNKEKGLGAGPLWGLMHTARNLRLRLIDLGERKPRLSPSPQR
ncbi:hypothetical protein V1527DRAFT_449446 [Lipomyces starkeyi]